MRKGSCACAALALAACGGGTLSPFRHHLEVGKDPYVVFVAEGPDGRPDLFASRGDGGQVLQVTFGRAIESSPALSPDGGVVAFLRAVSPDDTAQQTVWLLNLVNGAEREVPLPRKPPVQPEWVAWGRDGRTVYIRNARGDVWRANAPPAPPDPRPVTESERAAADSAFKVWLGDPPFAQAMACPGRYGICARGDSSTSEIDTSGTSPLRWGPDSVGYFLDDKLVVRPLGPGRMREVRWASPPRQPRQATVFTPASAPR